MALDLESEYRCGIFRFDLDATARVELCKQAGRNAKIREYGGHRKPEL
jgi:hypothetical protein